MTLISMIATDNFISFMSDGRVNKVDTKESIREDYPKVIKVNNAILAVGGNFKVSEILFENVNKFDTRNAKVLVHSLFNEIGNRKVKNAMSILVGGLDEDGNVYYSGFDQNATELADYYPPKGIITRLATESGEPNKMSNFDRLDQLIGDLREITLKEAKSIQEKLNASVSEFDKTVGKKTFHEFITKYTL